MTARPVRPRDPIAPMGRPKLGSYPAQGRVATREPRTFATARSRIVGFAQAAGVPSNRVQDWLKLVVSG